MKIKLISFTTCPFVQRAVIMLLFKDVKHDIEFIDLANKPDWFMKISPRGKVPVLVADNQPIFESQAICEFLEETHPSPAVLPKDPVERAQDRAWFAFASEDLFMPMYRFSYTDDPKVAAESLEFINHKLERLNTEMEGRNFLSATNAFGMADVAMAPFLYRADFYKRRQLTDLLQGFSNLENWSNHVMDLNYVKNSVPADFENASMQGLEKNNSTLLPR